MPIRSNARWRIEPYCPGIPASVAMLCGPHQSVALPPCEQRLSNDGRFCYMGGRLPLAGQLAERATQLAHRAQQALPPANGYLGIDLVLGDNTAEDFVIEVNPRLTTSYVGLRQLADVNLAEAMLRIARGEATEIRFRPKEVTFDADGGIRVGQNS